MNATREMMRRKKSRPDAPPIYFCTAPKASVCLMCVVALEKGGNLAHNLGGKGRQLESESKPRRVWRVGSPLAHITVRGLRKRNGELPAGGGFCGDKKHSTAGSGPFGVALSAASPGDFRPVEKRPAIGQTRGPVVGGEGWRGPHPPGLPPPQNRGRGRHRGGPSRCAPCLFCGWPAFHGLSWRGCRKSLWDGFCCGCVGGQGEGEGGVEVVPREGENERKKSRSRSWCMSSASSGEDG